eukprot:TRINITY_DN5053_c0_g1_i2.p1 TRINITY_DN5053_c0_g1~~TRINITY_DN5053_c0_g1_i2.p1  ORF type:complete len:250 (-),score=53.72 TRINITY_DN5053_c0_g1_i2:589-1338(-)
MSRKNVPFLSLRERDLIKTYGIDPRKKIKVGNERIDLEIHVDPKIVEQRMRWEQNSKRLHKKKPARLYQKYAFLPLAANLAQERLANRPSLVLRIRADFIKKQRKTSKLRQAENLQDDDDIVWSEDEDYRITSCKQRRHSRKRNGKRKKNSKHKIRSSKRKRRKHHHKNKASKSNSKGSRKNINGDSAQIPATTRRDVATQTSQSLLYLDPRLRSLLQQKDETIEQLVAMNNNLQNEITALKNKEKTKG